MRRGPSPPPRLAGPGSPSLLLRDLHQAVAHANAGRWRDAQAHAQKVLALQPNDPSALNVLGLVAMNTGRPAEAINTLERAAAAQPANPFIRYNLGEAHRRTDALEAAAAAFGRAARLKPDFAEAFAAAGDARRGLGQTQEAEALYQQALRIAPGSPAALHGYGLLRLGRGEPGAAADLFAAGVRAAPPGHPLHAAFLMNLGTAQLHLGQQLEGLEALAQALEADPKNPEGWRRLASALRHTRVAPATPEFRAILLKLFERADVNPRNLATAAVAVLRQEPDIDRLLDTIVGAPRAVAATLEREAAAARLVQDPVFRSLLTSSPIPDVGVELLLVQLRADLLDLALAEPEALEAELDLAVALARQAFLNEYVLFATGGEQQQVDALIAGLDRDGLGQRIGDATRIAIVAAYRPLGATRLAARLQGRAIPGLVDLLREQLAEPAEEAELRATLPARKPPTDATSLAVKTQYEQNPYPRWTRCSLGEPLAFRAAVRSALPDLAAGEIPDLKRPRVLVAGCGTGLETLRVASTYRSASILAVDLSAASLGYAMRKARAYGLTDVRHLQADILDLPTLPERFDLIDSFGVLHHMADPAKGLQVLAGLLNPQGFLFLGLYSAIGRQAVAAARAHIAGCGYRDDADGIRALRRDLMVDGGPPGVERVMSPASDFWTLSDCRDLLFHVNEHRFTLPQIGELLSAADLEFLGLRFGHASDQALYLAAKGPREALRDLEALHRHELDHPEAFGDTYRLWARPKGRVG